jgi:hypothetical protein
MRICLFYAVLHHYHCYIGCQPKWLSNQNGCQTKSHGKGIGLFPFSLFSQCARWVNSASQECGYTDRPRFQDEVLLDSYPFIL